MPNRSSGLESTFTWRPGRWAWPIALVGGLIGPALATEDTTAEIATSRPTPPHAVEAVSEAPRQPLDELQHRLQGMEGKLRESALARKSADQARMEAERRLAETMQALEELQGRHADLEQRLGACESARTQLVETLQRQAPANRTLYQVRPSDSLASISLRFYGRPDQWRSIFAANRHLLDNPDRLTPGMALIIP